MPRSRRYHVYFRYTRFVSKTEEPEDCPVPQHVIAYDAKDARDQAELIFLYGYPTHDGTKPTGSDLKSWDDLGCDFVITRIEPEDKARTERESAENGYLNRG